MYKIQYIFSIQAFWATSERCATEDMTQLRGHDSGISSYLADVGHDEGVLGQVEASNRDLAEGAVQEAGGRNVRKPVQNVSKYVVAKERNFSPAKECRNEIYRICLLFSSYFKDNWF